MKKFSPIAAGLCLAFLLTAGAEAQSRRQSKNPEREELRVNFLDSSEAQWGQRSVNDSVYLGYPVNAVYLERGRRRLPETFWLYEPEAIGERNVVQSTRSQSDIFPPGPGSPTTITINGREQPLRP